MKAIIIAGSLKDRLHVEAISRPLLCDVEVHYCSAHKEPHKLLALVEKYNRQDHILFVTVAGRSNALSGVVAANTDHLVIACPPFESTADYLTDIHSTLRMPSGTPVLTVLGTDNCLLAIMRVVKSWGWTTEDYHNHQAVS